MLSGIIRGIRCNFAPDPLAPLLSIRRWLRAGRPSGAPGLIFFATLVHGGSSGLGCGQPCCPPTGFSSRLSSARPPPGRGPGRARPESCPRAPPRASHG